MPLADQVLDVALCAVVFSKTRRSEQRETTSTNSVSNTGKRTLREGTVCEGKSAIQPGAEKWLELLAQSALLTTAQSN